MEAEYKKYVLRVTVHVSDPTEAQLDEVAIRAGRRIKRAFSVMNNLVQAVGVEVFGIKGAVTLDIEEVQVPLARRSDT